MLEKGYPPAAKQSGDCDQERENSEIVARNASRFDSSGSGPARCAQGADPVAASRLTPAGEKIVHPNVGTAIAGFDDHSGAASASARGCVLELARASGIFARIANDAFADPVIIVATCMDIVPNCGRAIITAEAKDPSKKT